MRQLSKRPVAGPETLRKLQEEMEKKNAIFEAMKTAFFNEASFQGKVPTYEDLHRAAGELITANHDLQRGRFGRVQAQLSASNLL